MVGRKKSSQIKIQFYYEAPGPIVDTLMMKLRCILTPMNVIS